MGFLKEYKDIARAAKHFPAIPSEELIESFQIQLFDLIYEAYKTIRTPELFLDKLDETQISLSLFDAVKIIVSREGLPCYVVSELHEYTDEIREGKKSTITAKRYDLYFESWSTPARVEFGVEAKLLVENDFMSKTATTLIREYVSDAGMRKYIDGIYKKRGCMIGYVVEGRTHHIVEKINSRIRISLTNEQCLIIDNSGKFKHRDIYKSEHPAELDYILYHLMLQFS